MGVFEIIGPIMIGPSSSHTAGAARLGLLGRAVLKEEPKEIVIILYGSFAKTYRGHGTDRALIAGVLGCKTDDGKIRDAFSLAKERGLSVTIKTSDEEVSHPNTVRLIMKGEKGREMEVLGCSLGGGKVLLKEINGYPAELSGDSYTIVTQHTDKPGVIAAVTTLLSKNEINISTMKVFRKHKNEEAVMIIETDTPVTESMTRQIEVLPAMRTVFAIEPIL